MLLRDLENDPLSVVASFLDFRVAARFDCCSKAFYASGFVWNSLQVAIGAPEPALKRFKLHHKSLVSFSCSLEAEFDFAEQFVDQIEHVHILLSSATSLSASSLLQKLRVDRLTSLSLTIRDTKSLAACLEQLQRILPHLTRLKIVIEAFEVDTQLLEVISSNCSRLEYLSFESPLVDFSKPDKAPTFRKIIDANRATLKFVDVYLTASNGVLPFSALRIQDLTPSDNPGAWGLEQLQQECLALFGVPFECFGTSLSQSRLAVRLDYFGLWLIDIGFDVLNADHAPTLWCLFEAYYPVSTLPNRFFAALGSFLRLYRVFSRFYARLSPEIPRKLLNFVEEAASVAHSKEQILCILDIMLETYEDPVLRPFSKMWFVEHADSIRDDLLTKVIDSTPRTTQILFFGDSDLLKMLGVDFHYQLRVNGVGFSRISIYDTLGACLALKCKFLLTTLAKQSTFDPFTLRTLAGETVFDLTWELFCNHPAEPNYPEEFGVLLHFALEKRGKTEQDLQLMFTHLLSTCTLANLFDNVPKISAFHQLLPDEVLFERLSAHYQSTFDCDFLPQDIEAMKTHFVGSNSLSPEAIAELLWYDLLRKVNTKFQDRFALLSRLEIVRCHSREIPAFVADFLTGKGKSKSAPQDNKFSEYPVPGIIDPSQAQSLRETLLSSSNDVRLQIPVPGFSCARSPLPFIYAGKTGFGGTASGGIANTTATPSFVSTASGGFHSAAVAGLSNKASGQGFSSIISAPGFGTTAPGQSFSTSAAPSGFGSITTGQGFIGSGFSAHFAATAPRGFGSITTGQGFGSTNVTQGFGTINHGGFGNATAGAVDMSHTGQSFDNATSAQNERTNPAQGVGSTTAEEDSGNTTQGTDKTPRLNIGSARHDEK